MVVNVWDWRNSCKVATNKMSFNVSAISFTKDGSYFVAAGNRFVVDRTTVARVSSCRCSGI